ncbi:protoporphyrinogen oxidase [Phycomyces blakesleeanus]|uniref:Protoporphyrinogen oxidase n=1 Tax=Phycomyces blakesleeanus TaxID=4837 RepID=A0ABR3AN18_PHYBL
MASSIAVLGGGISGLSAAYYLARFAPRTTKIVLIESSRNLGGWLKSNRVPPGLHSSAPVADEKGVLFESGPHIMNPRGTSGAVLLEMVKDVCLTKEMLTINSSDYIEKGRSIYYKDQVNVLPTHLTSLWKDKSPVTKSVFRAILRECFVVKNAGLLDETIYDFVCRRFNQHVALNIVGPYVQGMVLGDIKALSVRSVLPLLYDLEQEYRSVTIGYYRTGGRRREGFRERGLAARARRDDPVWFGQADEWSGISFKQGVQTLPDRLSAYLSQCENVEVRLDESVERIDPVGENDVKVTTSRSTMHFEHVLSALPSATLHELTSSCPLPHLTSTPCVDVAVAGLAYPSTASNYTGNSIVLPHPDSDYKSPVPGTLSVDCNSNNFLHQDHEPHFKITTAFGGHQWKNIFGTTRIQQLDPQLVFKHAQEVARVLFGIKDRPTHGMVSLNPKCLPQYTLGHEERMGELHNALQTAYSHRMSVTGQSYFGTSVPESVENSRMLVESLVVSGALGSREMMVNGLWQIEENQRDEWKDSNRLSKSHIDILLKS